MDLNTSLFKFLSTPAAIKNSTCSFKKHIYASLSIEFFFNQTLFNYIKSYFNRFQVSFFKTIAGLLDFTLVFWFHKSILSFCFQRYACSIFVSNRWLWDLQRPGGASGGQLAGPFSDSSRRVWVFVHSWGPTEVKCKCNFPYTVVGLHWNCVFI